MFSSTTSHVQKRDLLCLCYTKVKTHKNLFWTVETKRSYQSHLIWFLPVVGFFHLTGLIKPFPTQFSQYVSWFLKGSLLLYIAERADIDHHWFGKMKRSKRNRRIRSHVFYRSIRKDHACFTYNRHIVKTYSPGFIVAVPCSIYWGLQDLIVKFYQKLSKTLNTHIS